MSAFRNYRQSHIALYKNNRKKSIVFHSQNITDIFGFIVQFELKDILIFYLYYVKILYRR